MTNPKEPREPHKFFVAAGGACYADVSVNDILRSLTFLSFFSVGAIKRRRPQPKPRLRISQAQTSSGTGYGRTPTATPKIMTRDVTCNASDLAQGQSHQVKTVLISIQRYSCKSIVLNQGEVHDAKKRLSQIGKNLLPEK